MLFPRQSWILSTHISSGYSVNPDLNGNTTADQIHVLETTTFCGTAVVDRADDDTDIDGYRS